ncbi:Mediator of RNA polymerase II transcription subunit 21 [Cyphellophora attinorum]|uniref:Mediator of RNA polymerase II transcription subunit 21 n=1 Tax=Cyphellophora attinorum TaxID=1664694 RepID=A0A0N1HET4_9EURO|nr:Mediator of RNA polymerase II transcription subunit 21 [Phialophora attinorum]KPI43610.1 Mediator of RNA polymerase II transcription subunit 21 [Phialophora attinorum]
MSSDILTQLQTCYDQLLIQFFSTVSYNVRRHPLIAPAPVASDPYTNPTKDVLIENGRHQYVRYKLNAEDAEGMDLRPQEPEVFDKAQEDLAEDLVMKAQQIEYLIKRLPGLGQGEEEQNAEIRRLVEEVKIMERRRKEKRKEMRKCLEQLDHVVLGMSKSIDVPESDGSTDESQRSTAP